MGDHPRLPRLRSAGPDAPLATTTLPHPGGVVDQSTESFARVRGQKPRRQESRSMFRETPAPTTESDLEDHSMRLVEYAMAIVAVVAAGILAFLR